MEYRLINKIILMLIFICISFENVSLYDDIPGGIFPDKVEIEIGGSANISCWINLSKFPNGTNSSALSFVDAKTQEKVAPENMAIWNESTIVFMLRNATEQNKSYLCQIESKNIMETKVYVGTRPKPVSNFRCRSYDFEYMVCNFTEQDNNILTTYNLTFYANSDNYRYIMSCNTDDKPLRVCNTTEHKPQAEIYDFRLTGSNPLGTEMFSYKINNWNNMVPPKPGLDFRVVEISADTLQLAWKMLKYDSYKRRGKSTLQWEVILKPDGFEEQNLSDYILEVLPKKELQLRVTKLPYAYYWYELRIRVRVKQAPLHDDNMWSQAFVYRFRTAATTPDQAPRTDVGSFYVDSTETQVRLYWEQLPFYKENGANFSYVIKEVKQNGKTIPLKPLQFELNSAKFEYQQNSHYEFLIKSRNHLGESLEESVIEIFPMIMANRKTHIPRVVQKVHETNKTYTLTWQPPIDRDNLQDFTVYWCNSKRAQQNECEGSIHFKHVNKHTTRFNTDPQLAQHEHQLNLAVSANYLNYNTGMHWTVCAMYVNNDLEKIEPDLQESNDSITVQWTSGGICTSILDGYKLTYCETDNNMTDAQAKCVGNPIVISINDKNAKKYTLENLKPYTIYKIEMFMHSPMKVGKSSDPKYVRTKEGAPSEPRHLQYSNVTNTSAIISWKPPTQPNGNIRHYVVNYNNKQIFVKPNIDVRDSEAKIVYELRNLSSYTMYKVYVKAETVNSSPTSNDISFTTLIGYPSVPGSASPIGDTSNNTIIQWSKPAIPSGRVDFYEVAVIVKRNDEFIRQRISIVIGATSCGVKIPVCIDHEYKTIIKVRAVNAAEKPNDSAIMDSDDDSMYYEDNDDLSCIGGEMHNERIQNYRNSAIFKLYKSPWQHGPTYGCSANRLSKITIFALMVVVCSLCLMTAVYFARKKYNKMANIECTLPPGLESYPTKIGIDNETLDKHEFEHHRHNEKQNLLQSEPLVNGSNGKNLDYTRTTSESSTDSMVESITDSIEPYIKKNTEKLNTENIQKSGAERSSDNGIMRILPVSNSYIKQGELMNWQAPEELPTTSQCGGGGGYVSVGCIGLASLNANGYVQSQAIQKSFPSAIITNVAAGNTDNSAACFNNGYTTLDQLDKRTVNALPLDNFQALASDENDKPSSLISGYVTQRDLTVFGQQRFN